MLHLSAWEIFDNLKTQHTCRDETVEFALVFSKIIEVFDTIHVILKVLQLDIYHEIQERPRYFFWKNSVLFR